MTKHLKLIVEVDVEEQNDVELNPENYAYGIEDCLKEFVHSYVDENIDTWSRGITVKIAEENGL